MNYCPHCGEKLPQDEVKRPLPVGLPVPPADTVPHWQPPWHAPECPGRPGYKGICTCHPWKIT